MARREDTYSARMERDALVLSGSGELPTVCMKCGAHGGVTRRAVKLSWAPLWARMMIFCGIGLLVFALMRRYAKLDVPLCADCNARWSVARTVLVVTTVVLVAAFIAVRLLGEPRVVLASLPAFLAAFTLVMVLFVRPRTIHASRITDTEVHLQGVDEGAAQEIVKSSA